MPDNARFKFMLLILMAIAALFGCDDESSQCDCTSDGDETTCSDSDADSSQCTPCADGDEDSDIGENAEIEPDDESEETDADSDAPERPLYWIDGMTIRDTAGRAIHIHGINVSNHYKYAPLEEPEFVGAEGFRRIAEMGFNTVRLVIQWASIEPEPDQYDDAYLAMTEQRVRWATAAGLYVLVDMHQDIFGVGFGDNGAPRFACDEALYASYVPKQPWFLNYFEPEVIECFDRFWADRTLWDHHHRAALAVAERIADDPLVIGFEPFNEPSAGSMDIPTFEHDVLMPFHERFADVVLPAIPGRLLFFEPTTLYNSKQATAFDGPVPFPGVFAPHYYNNSVEIFREYDGDASALRELAAATAIEAEKLGTAAAFGEMGGFMDTPNLDEYLFHFFDAQERRGIGSIIWDYSTDDKGILDPETFAPSPHVKAMSRVLASAVAGTIRQMWWDYSTLRFLLEWDEDTDAGVTEITLPKWVQEAGYTAILDGEEKRLSLNEAKTRLLIGADKGGRRSLEILVDQPYPE